MNQQVLRCIGKQCTIDHRDLVEASIDFWRSPTLADPIGWEARFEGMDQRCFDAHELGAWYAIDVDDPRMRAQSFILHPY